MKFVDLLNLSAKSVNDSVLRSTEQSRETISTPAFKVIGRDRDRDHILKLLRDDFPECSKCYSVIGIWGMGGSGKTTLAQFVCEYVKKDEYFDIIVWAYVSQNFSVKSIFERIWEPLFSEACPKYNSIEGLQNKIKEKLKGQRFFLVLDDAWCDQGVTKQQFQQLFAPFQDAKRGSKILVTTRVIEAAKALGATELIALRQLDQAEFLELFMSQAFCHLKEKRLEERLKPIGEQIAAKLCRSPLAATTVAAQLRKNLDPDFWLSMREQNLLNETMGALLLSYQNLPPHLQRCFAFCSLFPKGYKFSQDRLVSLWIGEGFIETEGSNRHVRDIGNEYILELISSCFLQVNKNDWGDIEYSVHDLLHDLAEKVSEGDCFRIECDEKRDILAQTHHLYIEVRMFEEYIEKICKLKDLRTIIIGSYGTLKEKDLNALFKRSKKFYVVDFYCCSTDGWPEYVFSLENLRYLDYGDSNIMEFPKLSTRLYQLCLLRGMEGGFNCIRTPNVGRLILLQDLVRFKVGNKRGCGLEQLGHLRDLYGELIINNLNNVKSSEEAHQAKLFDKKSLRALELDCSRGYHSRTKDDEVILDELCPPPQLEQLTIRGYSGKRCPRWFSEYNKSTTHLKELKLRGCQFLEALPETNNLIHLQSLTINNLPSMKWWASLPSNLVNLTLSCCQSLAFLSEEDLKIKMSTRSGEQFPINKDMEKLVHYSVYHQYLEMQKKLDSICQLKEVNGELYLPLTLQILVIGQCFISDKILANSLKGHTQLTHLELCDIILITCIPGEVLSSLTNLQVLIINGCLMLTSVGGLNTLSTLEELKIEQCPCLTIESLDLGNSNSLSSLSLGKYTNLVSLMGLNELNNLKYLRVVGCDKLQCSSDTSKLPGLRCELTISKLLMLELISRDGLSSLVSLKVTEAEQEYFTREECKMVSYLSSLETIVFQFCKMKSLPDLSSLHSLTRLEIHWCEYLTSLSALPPSVHDIYIYGCNDEFKWSCEDTNHPNWQKISHIPMKYISYQD